MKEITIKIPKILHTQLERMVTEGNMSMDDAVTITILTAMNKMNPHMIQIMKEDDELNYYVKLLRLG